MVMRSALKKGWQNANTGSESQSHVARSCMPPSRVAVKVSQGYIYGVRDATTNGEHYYYFKGIPYAKPPVGNLRFMSPVPIDKFPVTYLDCTAERGNCMGMDVISKEITGSEDGLYLNVYTPVLPRSDGVSQNLPVMVYVHGGGLIGGHADSSMYHPNYLLQEGVLVVTVNYRLGILGFLCLPEAGIEGNAGLKDQRMALQWVSQNISKFGGDPNNVTLFGASSGAIAVNLHCLSKESKKYFHKAIMQSGSIYLEWGHQEKPEQKARKMAELLGANPTTDEEVYQVLKNAPARKLFELQFKAVTEREELVEKLFQIPFLPVVEREQSSDAIITKHPTEIMRDPDGVGIPIIQGYNEYDGMMVLLDAVKNPNMYNLQPERFIPRTLNVDCYAPEARKLAMEIKKAYFGDQDVSRETVMQLVELFTDKYILSYRISFELWAKYQTKAKMFGYRFSFDGLLNKGKAIMSFGSLKGTCHIDEVYYIFSSPILRTEVPKTSKAYEMRNKMVHMWGNFAKCSDPTPDGDMELSFKWNPVPQIPVDLEDVRCTLLSISAPDEIGMAEMPERERMEYWTELYRKYNGHVTNILVPTVPLLDSVDLNNNSV
ncbi:esterase B1 [Aedes aegypti]|uniref:Carboxylic ester hydrolase n=1 Tax=Aedes aegypti TaxID=7159 RepID=A0A1S4FV52_AEDAE|nr:esterase B1 [Aedes aegypti]